MTYDTMDNDVTMAGGAEGARLAGRYRVVRQLGQGGMGSVWLAEDTQLDNKQFAIKMLPSILVSNKRAYRQLKDEALVAMRLVHPNIVQIRAFEENGGNPFLVMDYIDGQTLDDYIGEQETGGTAYWGNGRPARLERAQVTGEADVLRILRPIAAALDYAHGQGVVHRDVKPGNVMIAKDGTPYILDFGIAREIQETMTRVTGKLSSGTLLYMSPEQLNGDAPKKEQDIYSFAAMAYECLKGEPPFVRGQIEHQILNVQPAPLVGRDAPIAPLVAGIMAGLAKKPEDRPKTCAAVLEGNVSRGGAETRRNEYGNGRARTPAAPIGKEFSRGGAETRRTNGAGKVLAVLAFVAAIAVGGLIYHQNQPRYRAEQAKHEAGSAKESAGKAGRSVVQTGESTDRPQPTRKDVDAIYVEARVQNGACGRLDPSDGFKSQIEDCQKSFDRAMAQYNLGHWAEAALAFTNVVGECKTLIEQSIDRDKAKTAADVLADAIKNAQSAGAKEYAPVRFSSATDLANRGRDEFEAFKFSDATATYASAKSQFDLAAKEAGLAKQEEARKKREADEAAQQAEAERERRAKWRQEGRQFTIDEPYGFAMTMKWCPAGTFTMGSPTTEEGRYDDERQHQVTLTKGFWMGETEVTQGQWKKLMDGETIVDLARKGLRDDTVYNIAGTRQTLREFWGMARDGDPMNRCGDLKDDVPVYNVSWNEAVEFCRRLTQRERAEGRIPDGYEYRLPTEAEWEYASRAGTTTALPNGRDIRILGQNNAPVLDDIAWYGGNSSVGFNGRGWDTSGWPEKQYPGDRACARDVKGKQANRWGLYDMIGNVWEWCNDWYGDYPYGSVSDPTGSATGAFRVDRGGGWFGFARFCRSAGRDWCEPGFRDCGLGFRVALAPSH